MLLSSILGKTLYENGKERGVCDGVFLSSKSRAIKYLSCRAADNLATPFCLSFSHVDYVTDVVRLKRFCIAMPDKCEKFVLGLPVYDENGIFLGNALDMEIEGQSAVYLLLNGGKRIPASLISSCHDAVILKKAPAFPLAQRIPAHSLSLLDENCGKEKFVTKKTLQSATKKGNLIKFTLSLSPFSYIT